MILTIVIFFLVGYIAIALENKIKINKAATALITGVICWLIYILATPDKHSVNEHLMEHLSDISGIIFFLFGAMTIVELIDVHDGFDVVSRFINVTGKRKLIFIISFLSFFLSAILDNLTTTIVMVSLLRKLIPDKQDRLLFTGMVVIAANAGGAWTPIGDVTTTMLWIGGQISAGSIISKLFIPSLISMIIPVILISISLKGNIESKPVQITDKNKIITAQKRGIILVMGILALVSVPVFKLYTHLPPFMGMLLGLGVMWVITELIHLKTEEVEKEKLSLIYVMHKIDMSGIMFFLGILLAVAALESSSVLPKTAEWLSAKIGNENIILVSVGILSSVIDNVPIVAAFQGMYPLSTYPVDSYFWSFLAYTAGTGGSILIIGSAAGVAAMGVEKIDFFWYVKKISWLALVGYFAGAVYFIFAN